MPEPKTIVCYAINGSGLGHLTRLTAVAKWIRRYVALLDCRPPEILFLTSSDASDLLADARFAAFKIPSKTVAVRSELNKSEYKRLAKHFVWNTLGVFSPNLLVVDTFPSGSFDELFQILDGPFKKSFIFRDVKSEYAARPMFRAAISLFDKVVSPHRRRDSTTQVAAPGDCTYTGEVVQFEREELLPRSMGREQLGIADHQRLVYLSAGGGGDPNAEETLRSLVNAFRSQDDIHLLVGAGPLYRGQRLASPNLTWFDSPAVWRYFGTIDAAISAGGYNSFHELLFARVPTAFFSQAKIADDQQQRIRNAVQHGACQEISTPQNTDLVIKTTRELLDEEITARIRSACDNWIPENGARQCAIELLSPLYDAKQLDWASNVLSPALTHALERINGGTTGALADWLTPLAPQEQFQSLKNHSGLNDIMRHLSPAAAHEVEQILAKEKVHSSHFKFEATLLDLLNTIQSAAAALGVPARQLAEESLKTLNSAIKKQPPLAKQNNQQTPWACEVIKTVRFLLTLSISDCSAFDILQMFRIFPRVVDVNVGEAGMLFEHFMRHRIAMGDLPHAILQQIQLLKVLDTKITRERLESITEGIST